MTATCLNSIEKLSKSVDDINYVLIDNMTQPGMRYNWVCIKPNVTYTFYYEHLKKEWESIVGQIISQSKCDAKLSNLINFSQYYHPEKIAQLKEISAEMENLSNDSLKDLINKKFAGVDVDNLVLNVVAESILKKNDYSFNLDPDFITSMLSLSRTLAENCYCELSLIFKHFIKKYKSIYSIKLQGKTKDEVIDAIRDDYNRFKQILKNIDKETILDFRNNILHKTSSDLTGIYSFSVEDELEKLIPNELGSLKQFFIKVISAYYNNLHPIIWAQIFKGLADNLFVELPYTPNEIFSFVSKHLLLNSGPFILKILQMIRPVLSPELAQKYNLTKLTYPLLKPREINLMLERVVYDWDIYNVIANFSASVGHVSKVMRVDDPSNPFMIKMIKPLAVAQSCWEYKILHNIFPKGSCEQSFVINMLESNGSELNVKNEIENINEGHKCYTDTYNNVYGYNINAKLTTIQNIPGIIVPDCWYALTMTIAPGVPLSKLVENDLVNTDTKYRARLHRCLDILVYKFFQNLVQNGFYHGDLHSGNIFFSYPDAQLTLIDFGAVGKINIYEDDPDMKTLLSIIVMSTFYNYDEILDVMTNLLNTKCTEQEINTNSVEYQKFKQELYMHKIINIKNQKIEQKNSETFKNDIFGQERIAEETVPDEKSYLEPLFDPTKVNSIYSYLDYSQVDGETIVENRDVLPDFSLSPKEQVKLEENLPRFTQIMTRTNSISFAGILEKIIKFYAVSGINIAIKFSEFYEFQKAYALLLGVLHKVGYNPYRSGIAIKKAIINWRNLPQLMHIKTVAHVVSVYKTEKEKYDNLETKIGSINIPMEIPNDTKNAQTIQCPVKNTNFEEIDIKSNKKIYKGGATDAYYNKYLKYRSKYEHLLAQA